METPVPPRVMETSCTICNGPYSPQRSPRLLPGTSTVYGHQACINASTFEMKTITQEQIASTAMVDTRPAPDSIEDLLIRACTLLDSTLDRLHPKDLVIAQEVLGSQTLINEALAELRGIKALVTGR